MLCINHYTQEYIDQCRSRVDEQIGAYREPIAAARSRNKAAEPRLDAAMESFESLFFNNMVLVIDSYFCHRSRTIEGIAIEDVLDGGLPRAYSPDLYKQKCAIVFEHVYEMYGDGGQTTSSARPIQ